MSLFALWIIPFLLLSVAAFVWWLACLIQAMSTPDSVWTAADQSKLLYVLLMIFLGVIGTIVYVLVARPPLKRVAAHT